jgi:hypothetical protein
MTTLKLKFDLDRAIAKRKFAESCTVGENIISTIKMRNSFCYHLKIFFQYCDRNIVLFSIAPHLVIILPTLR